MMRIFCETYKIGNISQTPDTQKDQEGYPLRNKADPSATQKAIDFPMIPDHHVAVLQRLK